MTLVKSFHRVRLEGRPERPARSRALNAASTRSATRPHPWTHRILIDGVDSTVIANLSPNYVHRSKPLCRRVTARKDGMETDPRSKDRFPSGCSRCVPARQTRTGPRRKRIQRMPRGKRPLDRGKCAQFQTPRFRKVPVDWRCRHRAHDHSVGLRRRCHDRPSLRRP